MKRLILFFSLLCFTPAVFPQETLQFKISKPYGILNFMETAIGKQGTSSTLQKFIIDHTKGDTTFQNMMKKLVSLRLDYSYERDEFPENRRRYRSLSDLIYIAAVKSDNLQQFKEKTIGILPNSTHQQFFQLLADAEVYYDRLIWNDYRKDIFRQMKALKKYEPLSGEIFNKLKTFYHSSWSEDISFIVTLYPIPGKHGNTTAKPYANSLCIGVLTGEKDHVQRMGVVLHEMCHVLFDEQPNDFQYKLEKYFSSVNSDYKLFAHNFFDEGVATACGNGWAYKYLNGESDTTEWYNDEYIDGFGHGLYPMVEQYLREGKTMDSTFVVNSVRIFSGKFPQSMYNYRIILNKISMCYDAGNDKEDMEIRNTLWKYFMVTSINSNNPLLSTDSEYGMKNCEETQLIIINRNFDESIRKIKEIFPEIGSISDSLCKNDCYLSFYDAQNRPVIIILAYTANGFENALESMQKDKYMDKMRIFYKL